MAIDFTALDNTGGVGDIAAKEVIAAGHPPIADKVILIDFDGTVAPFGYLFDFPEPYPGVAKFTQDLKSKGYRIGIFTSRLSKTWLDSANQIYNDHINYIGEYCLRYGIHFDFMTAEKVPSEAYIDDKAIQFRGDWAEMFVEAVKKGWL